MKILSVIQRYPPAVGGSETWCQETSRFLAKRGHRVRVLTLDIDQEEQFWREPSDRERTIAFGRFGFDEGVEVRRFRRSLPIHTMHHLLYRRLLDRSLGVYFYGPHSAEMYGRLWHEVEWSDVVFLHTVPYPHNYVAFVMAKVLDKPTIIVPHFHPHHPHYERSSNYWLLRHCDAVVTVTPFEKEYLAAQGIAAHRIHVTGNGLHVRDYAPTDPDAYRRRLEAEYGLEPDDRVITFLGRKTPEKGVGHLLEAVRSLLEELPLRAFLAGPGFEWFDRVYASLSPRDRERIVDLGMIPHQDKVSLLHLSDLLVLPSRYEAFGIVFLEAWICGTAVVGTTEGAMPSVIGNDGFLCRFGDPDDLAATLRRALSDPAALRARGQNGRAKVLERYTWDVLGRRVEDAVRAAHGGGNRTLKIVIATNAYPPRFIGGAELIAHQHALRLKRLGFQVVIFAGELDDAGTRHSIRHEVYDDIPVARVCLHSRDYSSDFFNFYHQRVHEHFDALLEDVAPDVVHFHNVIGLSASLIQAAKRRRIKTVVTLHDHWGFCFKNTLIKREGEICYDPTRCAECKPSITGQHWGNIPIRMRKDYLALQLRGVDAFISPSSYLARAYARAGVAEDRIRVIWNGIDVDRFARINRTESARVRFSFLGYLGRHKGIHTLLDALPLLGVDKERVTINLVGEGEKRADYEEQVRALGWEDSVRFWGKVDNLHIDEVYQETDVLILPSIWPENQPVSITEAMAARLPVIATRMGGIPDLVEDGRNGYLFPAGNARELARAMAQFLQDRSKIAEFGANSFRKIADNDFDHQVEKIIEVYQEETCTPAELLTPGEELIVCLGREVRPECVEAINRLVWAGGPTRRFVMLDWLEEDLLRDAKLIWVVDDHVRVEEVEIAQRNKLPLLVPEGNESLRSLCVQMKCGLYYADADDLIGCTAYLAEHTQVASALGINGFRAFYSGIRATVCTESGQWDEGAHVRRTEGR
jgi:glycosyltransferase involved in cell wall biosynthesis